jgi:hypothetical protein
MSLALMNSLDSIIQSAIASQGDLKACMNSDDAESDTFTPLSLGSRQNSPRRVLELSQTVGTQNSATKQARPSKSKTGASRSFNSMYSGYGASTESKLDFLMRRQHAMEERIRKLSFEAAGAQATRDQCRKLTRDAEEKAVTDRKANAVLRRQVATLKCELDVVLRREDLLGQTGSRLGGGLGNKENAPKAVAPDSRHPEPDMNDNRGDSFFRSGGVVDSKGRASPSKLVADSVYRRVATDLASGLEQTMQACLDSQTDNLAQMEEHRLRPLDERLRLLEERSIRTAVEKENQTANEGNDEEEEEAESSAAEAVHRELVALKHDVDKKHQETLRLVQVTVKPNPNPTYPCLLAYFLG